MADGTRYAETEVNEDAVTDDSVTADAASDDAVGEPRLDRRPSPLPSSPASRARRIGGRPLPGPRAADAAVIAPAPPRPAVEDEPADEPKPAGRKAARATAAAADADFEVTADEPRGPRPGLRWLPAGVLGVAVIVLLAFAAVASHGVYWAKPAKASAAAVREQVLAAAKTCFATLQTYDYTALPKAQAADAKCLTGSFAATYKSAFAKTVAATAPTEKAEQSAQINRAGIRSISPDGKQWVILIYGQLSVNNVTTTPGTPRIDVFGALVTMNKVGSKWLIANANTDVGDAVGS